MTLEASQDAASLQALKSLAEMGLESVSANNGLPNIPNNGLPNNPHGFVSMPNTTSAGNVVSSLTLNTSGNSFIGGVFAAAHYGTKPGHFETSKIHFPTSEGVSEVSERGNE